MGSLLRALAIAVVLALVGGPAALAQEEQPASLVVNYIEATAARVDGSNQLFAYAMVVDSDERPVPGARVQSAEVALDGSSTPVAAIVSQADDIASMLVLDASGSMVGGRPEAARTAVIDFVNSKQPGDQIGVMFFNDAVVYSSDFTTDRVTAISAVSFSPPERTAGSCLWDTLYEAVARTRRLPHGGRAIVLVTDGRDEIYPGGPPCSQITLDGVIQFATQERAHIPIHIMGIGNAQNLNPAELERLARETGGMHAIGDISSEIGGMFADLAAGVRAEFVVSAEVAAGGGEHSVSIRVSLDDGQQLVASAAVNVPAPVFVPPTQPPVPLPTSVAAGATATPTVISIPVTTRPAATQPPEVAIVEAGQDAADGDLLLRLSVRERGAPVTAVIVLLDGQPLGTLPPGAFDGEIRLPLGEIASGSHTISVEAYDTGGQVGEAQLVAVLRNPSEVASALPTATATPADLFTLSAPMSPSPGTPISPSATPATVTATRLALAPTETPAGAGVAPPASPPPQASPTPPPTGPQGPSTSPALIVIGLVVIAGGLVLAGLWWRARQMGGTPGEGFRYDAYAEGVAAGPESVEQTDLYEEPADEERTALWLGERAKARIDVLRSPDLEARRDSPYVLEAQRVTLGRDATNNICFKGDRFVSARHVRIFYIEGQWVLEELGALNKTFVNGQAVTGRVFLQDGDLIELGPYTRLRFTVEEPLESLHYDDDDEDLTRIHLE